jgi:hypothetical protein
MKEINAAYGHLMRQAPRTAGTMKSVERESPQMVMLILDTWFDQCVRFVVGAGMGLIAVAAIMPGGAELWIGIPVVAGMAGVWVGPPFLRRMYRWLFTWRL